jgi:hypothetical protein
VIAGIAGCFALSGKVWRLMVDSADYIRPTFAHGHADPA